VAMLFRKKARFKVGDIVYHRNSLEKGRILRKDILDQKKWVVEWGTNVGTHLEDELITHDEYATSEIEKKTKI